jgi:outer membrane receptor protein involved in Fe transport
MTIDKQQLEDSAFISVEQALNELPQFMAGGAGMSSGAVTSLQGANGLDGGRGSGDMFNSGLLPDNAGVIGVVVPGAANVNLRGLGANRSLTLLDGHRAMPVNASMTVDLNSIPSIAIGGMEVITGGASAVYGADALAGVTNIKFRDKFEGMEVRVKGGVNEVGDG